MKQVKPYPKFYPTFFVGETVRLLDADERVEVVATVGVRPDERVTVRREDGRTQEVGAALLESLEPPDPTY